MNEKNMPRVDPMFIGFNGERTQGGTKVEIVVDGVPRPLPYHLAVAQHSPSGFEWGYGGSGPAQLALAMCVELVGPEEATKVYQRVKDAVIAPLKNDKWEISGFEVFEAIDDES